MTNAPADAIKATMLRSAVVCVFLGLQLAQLVDASAVPEELTTIAQRKLDLGKMLLKSALGSPEREKLLLSLAKATAQQHQLGRGLHLAPSSHRRSPAATFTFEFILVLVGTLGGFAGGFVAGQLWKACQRAGYTLSPKKTAPSGGQPSITRMTSIGEGQVWGANGEGGGCEEEKWRRRRKEGSSVHEML